MSLNFSRGGEGKHVKFVFSIWQIQLKMGPCGPWLWLFPRWKMNSHETDSEFAAIYIAQHSSPAWMDTLHEIVAKMFSAKLDAVFCPPVSMFDRTSFLGKRCAQTKLRWFYRKYSIIGDHVFSYRSMMTSEGNYITSATCPWLRCCSQWKVRNSQGQIQQGWQGETAQEIWPRILKITRRIHFELGYFLLAFFYFWKFNPKSKQKTILGYFPNLHEFWICPWWLLYCCRTSFSFCRCLFLVSPVFWWNAIPRFVLVFSSQQRPLCSAVVQDNKAAVSASRPRIAIHVRVELHSRKGSCSWQWTLSGHCRNKDLLLCTSGFAVGLSCPLLSSEHCIKLEMFGRAQFVFARKKSVFSGIPYSKGDEQMPDGAIWWCNWWQLLPLGVGICSLCKYSKSPE